MSTFNGQDLFGSGPHAFRPLSWERALDRRHLPGLDGDLVLDMGRSSRIIVQTGRLQAPTAAALHALIEQIEACLDGKLHVLVDTLGRTLDRVMLEQFELATPVLTSRGLWCDYVARYRQQP